MFSVCFALYHLPLAAIGYARGICAALGLIVLILDFRRFVRRYKTAGLLHSEILVAPGISARGKFAGAGIREILLSLSREKTALENRMQSRYTDLIDYYTVWAHQIKTPIASLYLTLQNDGSRLQPRADTRAAAHRAVCGNGACYLRLDSDTTDYVIRSCDLDTILRQAVRKFAQRFIYRKIRLVFQPTGLLC